LELFWNVEYIPLFSLSVPEVKNIGGGSQVVADAQRHDPVVASTFVTKSQPSQTGSIGSALLGGALGAASKYMLGRGPAAVAGALKGLAQGGILGGLKGGLSALFGRDAELRHRIAALLELPLADFSPLHSHPLTAHVHKTGEVPRAYPTCEPLEPLEEWLARALAAIVDRQHPGTEVKVPDDHSEGPRDDTYVDVPARGALPPSPSPAPGQVLAAALTRHTTKPWPRA